MLSLKESTQLQSDIKSLTLIFYELSKLQETFQIPPMETTKAADSLRSLPLI